MGSCENSFIHLVVDYFGGLLVGRGDGGVQGERLI